jgi:hypothetical protein
VGTTRCRLTAPPLLDGVEVVVERLQRVDGRVHFADLGEGTRERAGRPDLVPANCDGLQRQEEPALRSPGGFSVLERGRIVMARAPAEPVSDARVMEPYIGMAEPPRRAEPAARADGAPGRARG